MIRSRYIVVVIVCDVKHVTVRRAINAVRERGELVVARRVVRHPARGARARRAHAAAAARARAAPRRAREAAQEKLHRAARRHGNAVSTL